MTQLEHDIQAAGPDEAIAIIGVSGRYPGAEDLSALWHNLRSAANSITPVPQDRWDWGGWDTLHAGGTANGGFLSDVDRFDPQFFHIPPRMAAYLDPNVRLFLETVWDLLEESALIGASRESRCHSRVGVFVGASYQLYSATAASETDATATALASYNEIANRVSYFFDLRGPSVAVDTGCSSSLVAIDMACRSLRDGDCQLAIAGGVNLSLHARKYAGLRQAHLLAERADRRSFSDGDGYLPAEGVGAVLLTPLSQAIRHQDSILAVIRSSTVWYCPPPAPDKPAAAADNFATMLQDAWQRAALDPQNIDYLETNAHGLKWWDAAQVRALTKAFGRSAAQREFCPLGSIAANFGNPEAAAGIAQLTRILLQLQHQTLTPTIKTEPANPDIDFTGTPFQLLQQAQPWIPRTATRPPGEPALRRAAVCCFGLSGTHASLLVEEAPSSTRASASVPISAQLSGQEIGPEIIVLSAATPQALATVARRLLDHLRRRLQPGTLPQPNQPPLTLGNVSYTLQSGREALRCRLAFLASSFDELLNGLQQLAEPPGARTTQLLTVYRGDMESAGEVWELLSGEAGMVLLEALLAARQLDRIALYWAQGGSVPWDRLRAAGSFCLRLSLPTYPFARVRCRLASSRERQEPGAADQEHPASGNGHDTGGGVELEKQHSAPVGELEEHLASLWCEVLGFETVGRQQSFFELGGDSRLGMHLISRVREALRIDLSLRQLFDAPSVAALRERIESGRVPRLDTGPVGQSTAAADFERGII